MNFSNFDGSFSLSSAVQKWPTHRRVTAPGSLMNPTQKTNQGRQNFRANQKSTSWLPSNGLESYYHVQEGESFFICNVCNKPFRTKSGLRNHVAKHAGTEKYRCFVCEKSFVHLHHYQGHMAGHDPSQMVHCRRCQKSFAYRTSCNKHEKTCTA